MKRTAVLAGLGFLFFGTGCISIGGDAGPTQTANEEIDAGKAEVVRADIRMGSGDLHLNGGGTKLMSGTFRYSEKVGRPMVRYDVAGGRGRLTVESPTSASSLSKRVNDWDLRMGSETPLEMNVNLGGGDADLDLAKLSLQSVDVKMGAGDLKINLAGRYTKDVSVKVERGAGDARIRLPKDMGVVVNVTTGIGSLNTNGLTKRDGNYYNEAWAEGKPALRMDVKAGVGDMTLSVE